MMKPQKQHSDPDVLDQRRQLREDFIASLGWKNVTLEELPADASFRRYYRLKGADRPLLLMQDPPDRPTVPPYVMVKPYVAIAEHLRSLGLHAPAIYEKDIENGLLLIEDFGDDTYTRLLNRGAEAQPLYEMAVDVLTHLHRHPARNALKLDKYGDRLLVDEAMLLLDWYYPALTGLQPADEMRATYREVWTALFTKFPANQDTLVLRDYHVDNLMLVPGHAGLMRCGLLDFQDAVTGQFSYDLMSLLEDARRDVPQDLQRHLKDRYFAAMGDLDREGFDYACRVLAAQRHAKVLGIFVRLFARDGKDRYLQFIPHVHRLFMNALAAPPLAPLKAWFGERDIDISAPLKTGK